MCWDTDNELVIHCCWCRRCEGWTWRLFRTVVLISWCVRWQCEGSEKLTYDSVAHLHSVWKHSSLIHSLKNILFVQIIPMWWAYPVCKRPLSSVMLTVVSVRAAGKQKGEGTAVTFPVFHSRGTTEGILPHLVLCLCSLHWFFFFVFPRPLLDRGSSW